MFIVCDSYCNPGLLDYSWNQTPEVSCQKSYTMFTFVYTITYGGTATLWLGKGWGRACLLKSGHRKRCPHWGAFCSLGSLLNLLHETPLSLLHSHDGLADFLGRKLQGDMGAEGGMSSHPCQITVRPFQQKRCCIQFLHKTGVRTFSI